MNVQNTHHKTIVLAYAPELFDPKIPEKPPTAILNSYWCTLNSSVFCSSYLGTQI